MNIFLQDLVSDVGAESVGVDWSICLRDREGKVLAAYAPDATLSTASIGKLLLLVEVARQCEVGSLTADELLRRSPQTAVSDSGLWQHLRVDALSVEDLAVLVAAVSDNLATNVLLEKVGLDQVREVAGHLGITRTSLLDRVRDQRGPNDPPGLSTGSADELSGFMSQLCRGELLSSYVSEKVGMWLTTGVDLSMVASPFGLDPLSHVSRDRGVLLCNKTGTDIGVRADVGFVDGPYGTVSYAVLANWKDSERDSRDLVLGAMRKIGKMIQKTVMVATPR